MLEQIGRLGRHPPLIEEFRLDQLPDPVLHRRLVPGRHRRQEVVGKVPANGTATASRTEVPLPAAAAPALPSTLVRRSRIFTDTQRTLYLVLRAAMPDHTIMAHVRIVDLLDLPEGGAAIEREARLRELLRERLDFVVCNSDLVPVAGLVLYDSSTELVPDESIKVESLRELGVRFLRFRADSLPRPAEIRTLVLG